ncbi:hypothetical protein BpHYR1_023652 [Brachionus plicatilis]|uniref:Uncharacterized protein n=1 Tax=Brachionus plicatilis TaxID=10195 RepID=A0A3M7T3Q8_BRAPC|nr:hypothetical protein BpHYR1_023652 [Brachionus plicatilis]
MICKNNLQTLFRDLKNKNKLLQSFLLMMVKIEISKSIKFLPHKKFDNFVYKIISSLLSVRW